MTRKCWKKVAALTWAFLECMFFSSVASGWTWLAVVLRSDVYFPEHCNLTRLNITPTLASGPSSRNGHEMLKMQNGPKQATQAKSKPCRPRRSIDVAKTGSDTPFLHSVTSHASGASVVRKIFVEGDWSSRNMAKTQQR